jgi:type IV pilus assembly protein PilB
MEAERFERRPATAALRRAIDPEAARAIPLQVLQRAVALPYAFDGGRLRVAVADLGDIYAMDELRLASALPLELELGPRAQIEHELRRIAKREVPAPEDGDATSISATDLVDELLLEADADNASDVHLVPHEDGLLVRIRIDGVVRDLRTLPAAAAAGVLARFKVLAKLDIAEHRRPQDGRFTTTLRGRELDMRVAILPSIEGEGAVVRMLSSEPSAPTLTELGLEKDMQMQLEEIVQKGLGAFLVTGPTGSGKSTTLHAVLADGARPEINVITVEDPVEFRVPGAFQLQVNTKLGVTFPSALRSVLRSDPDVIMIGEIRDAETAQIAVRAALTGHFVLTTLHTNDAPTALSRLREMGVEPFITGSAIAAVLAQRLVRRLCVECREAYTVDAAHLLEVGFPAELAADGTTLYRRRGCSACNRGYRGRVGVFQLMVMDDELRRMTVADASAEELTKAAAGRGMGTLWDDGLAKVTAGLTSIEELHRVIR